MTISNISKNIKECPFCGHDTYFIKQRYSGYCEYQIRYDNEETDNGELLYGAEFKNVSKYAWCSNCRRRLFKIED